MRCSYFYVGALLALIDIGAARAGTLAPGATSPQACVSIVVDDRSVNPICAGVGENGDFEFSIGNAILIEDNEGRTLASITSLSFGGNVDPTIGYAIGLIDFGAPSTFSFLFSTPVVSVPYTSAFQTYSISLTDAATDGASATPAAPNANIQRAFAGVGVPNTNLGVDVGTACTDGPGAPASAACGPNELTSFFAPTPYDTLQIRTAFQGSGGGDLFSVNGRADLTQDTNGSGVPEPTTVLYSGIGLIGIVVGLRRRRN
jgi:hypothetical protein